MEKRVSLNNSWSSRIVWGFMFLCCLAIGGYALSFFAIGGIEDGGFKSRFTANPIPPWLHIIAGGSCLILGALQFNRRLRQIRPALHRILGRIYLVAVLLSGVGGFVMAFSADGGVVTGVGFAMLAIVWLWSGAQAFRYIRQGNIAEHRRWMIRNFALTLAAVTLRVYLPLLQIVFGLTFEEAYLLVAWIAWVPNLIFAEWLILANTSATDRSK